MHSASVPATDYSEVTELAGDEVSREQVERVGRRYAWALPFCAGKDVLELACGTGPGLGLLLKHARRLVAGDISETMVARARAHYGARVNVERLDAQALPFADASFDVVILFEALYYLPRPKRFARECARVLRSDGVVLVSNANKDLYDFNPSPYSHDYHGVVELERLFVALGFECHFWGDTAVGRLSWRQRALRPVKKAAVRLGLMPKTANGKKFLKRLVFGRMDRFPHEITVAPSTAAISEIHPGQPDRVHKVLLCAATRKAH
jgi:SAM-dependent methyltransferase